MGALFDLVPMWVRLLAVSVVAGALLYGLGTRRGTQLERAAAEARGAKLAIARMQEMERNDAHFKALSPRERCLVFAHDSELPENICD